MTTPNVVYGQEYVAAFELLYQQKTSRLYRAVRHTRLASKSKFFSYIGEAELEEKTTRHRDTPLVDAAHSRRRLQVTFASRAIPLDDDDDLAMVADPGGTYLQSLAAGAGRRMDKKILAALGGPAYTGEDGSTTVLNYASGECRLLNGDGTLVTAGSDHADTGETALSITKLNILGRLFDDANVPSENRFLCCNRHNVNTLLVDTTYGSQEWMAIRDIQSGKVGKILGFELIVVPTGMFTTNATDSGCLECYAWQRDAVISGEGEGRLNPQLLTQQRADKDNMLQFYASQYFGATRLHGPGVVEILLDKE